MGSMRSVLSLFLLLPLLADANRDESNWRDVKSYDKTAVRRHPVNPNAISQVDSDDETRAIAYYYMIVNGTTIDREVRYFLSPYQVSAVGELSIFFLPGPLANWARNIGSYDIDPSEILDRFPPVALDDLPPMPRMIRRKIRELTYGFDLLRSSGVSREKYSRERASIGSRLVQTVDNNVATTTTTEATTTTSRARPTRMITPSSSGLQTSRPKGRRPEPTKTAAFDREEQVIFESIVGDLEREAKNLGKNNRVMRIGVNSLPLMPSSFVPPTIPTAPQTADAMIREFQFVPHSTPSTRNLDDYDESEKSEDASPPPSTDSPILVTRRLPSSDSDDSSSVPRVSHPRTHSIERSRLKDILVAQQEEAVQRPATILVGQKGFLQRERPRNKGPLRGEKKKAKKPEATLSSAEIEEKLKTIRSLQEELERQLGMKGIVSGRKRVEASRPEPELLDLEDLSAPETATLLPSHRTTRQSTTPQPTTTTTTTTTAPIIEEEEEALDGDDDVEPLVLPMEELMEEQSATTTQEPPTTTTEESATSEEPTTKSGNRRPSTRPRPITTTLPFPNEEEDEHGPPPPPPPPLDPEFHHFHEDLVGALAAIDEDPHILPPVPSEIFDGHSAGFFASERQARRIDEHDFNGRTTTGRTTITRRPTTTRRATTTTTPATTTTTTTEEPTTTPTTTARTLPTRRFVFVTQPPNTRAPTTTTTTTTPVPDPVPEFLDPTEVDAAAPVASGDEMKIDLRTLRALTSLSNDEIDRIRKRFAEGMAPMSSFVPLGTGRKIATAAAVKTMNMDVEYAEVEDEIEESNQENPGLLLNIDDEERAGNHVRDPRRIRLQPLNEPLRRFEKLKNGKRDKHFLFVRPDRFYDRNASSAAEKKRQHGVDEISEAISLGNGIRPSSSVVNIHPQPRAFPLHRPIEALPLESLPLTMAPDTLIGVPIHITLPPTTSKLTPPPVTIPPSPRPTRLPARPPAHTPPSNFFSQPFDPAQLQHLQHLTHHSVQTLQQQQHAAFSHTSPAPVTGLTPPPPALATVQPLQQIHLQQPVLQPAQLLRQVQIVSTTTSTTTTTTAAPTTTTTTPAPTTTAAATTAAAPAATTPAPSPTTTTPAARSAASSIPSAAALVPVLSFANPLHPSLPFTPALAGGSVNGFLQHFFLQQQAAAAAAKTAAAAAAEQQRTPKSVPAAPSPPTQSVQYPPGFGPPPPGFFWLPQQQVALPPPQFASPWFFPQAFGTKTAQAGRSQGDVITVSEKKDQFTFVHPTAQPTIPKQQ